MRKEYAVNGIDVKRKNSLWTTLVKHRGIYFMVLPVVIYYIVFHYIPMYGLIIAFKNYRPALGVMASPWAGVEHFKSFFESYHFARLVKNTLSINFGGLLFGFPAPIIFALFLNEVKNSRFKRTIQSVTYLPHFISITAICSMILDFFSGNGIINTMLGAFGIDKVTFFNNPTWFQPIYISTDIWAGFGWGSIVYLAALSAIDPTLYEAATLDGANRWQQMRHITLVGILPTVSIMLIMKVGHMMSLGSQKILLLYNPNIYETSDVISTFVYRKGLLNGEYSYTAAVDMFSSVLNFILLLSVNSLSRRMNETSLW